jgi:hypothetical protein
MRAFFFANTPILQYSSTPKRLAPVPAKSLNSDLVLRTRFSLLNINISKNHALPGDSQEESEIYGAKKKSTWELRRKK